MKESFFWLRNAILSCTNQFHLDACEILISLFKVKFDHHEDCEGLVNDLRMLLREKETAIIVEA